MAETLCCLPELALALMSQWRENCDFRRPRVADNVKSLTCGEGFMLRLRAATDSDLADIFTLIGELADYERLRHQMVGSLDDLRRHLFGEPRFAQVVMADWDGR